MKKRVLSIVIAVMMLIAILPVTSLAAQDLPKAVGADVSEMYTQDTQGRTVTGEEFSKYQLTVLNFWATWCGPCVSEMPHLQKFYEEHLKDGVNLMGVLMEDTTSTVSGGNNMMASMGLTYTCLRVDSTLNALYLRGFQGTSGASIPDTYLVNDQGKVISAKNGSFATYEELENWVMSYWNDPTLQSVSIPEKAEVGVNRMISLTAEYTPRYAFIDEAVWTSSDEKVAQVNEAGLVAGLSAGSATITLTVKSGEVTMEAVCEVTVKETPDLPDGTVYYKQTEDIREGVTYAIVVNYGGNYYMMSSEPTVDGRYRLAGTPVDASHIMLIPNDEGVLEVTYSAAENKNLWRFAGEEGGFSISNLETTEYLSTIRANGTYRLTLKNKGDVVWAYEDGTLKNTTSGTYTGNNQYLSYYEDAANKFSAAFDLTEKGSDTFVEVMFFEKAIVGGGEIVDKLPGDVNGNDKIDAGDATLVLRSVVGAMQLTEEQIELGDMNGNGSLDSGDASLILRQAVK